MSKENEIKTDKNNEQKVPLECPPRENKTVIEPIEDMKEKIEF